MEDFETLDINNDNRISTEEAKQTPELDTQAEFSIADENKDNYISFDEYNKVAELLVQSSEQQITNTTNPIQPTKPVTEQKPTANNDIGSAIMDYLKNRDTGKEAEAEVKNWKSAATDYANENFNTPKEKSQWDDFIRKEAKAEEVISKINPRIDPREVEELVFEDYVRKAKEKGTNKEHPIQITEIERKGEKKEEDQKEEKEEKEESQKGESTKEEQKDERKKTLLDAANHIISHGKSLPKEMKKKIQEITPKFEPFKFEHSSTPKDESVLTDELTFDNEGLETAYSQYGTTSIPSGSVSSYGGGYSSGKLSSANPVSKFDFGMKKGPAAGGMTYKEPKSQPMKLNFTNGSLIGDFKSKKRPINLELPKGKKNKKVEFPDLAPEVDQHNDMDVPKSAKINRPIIKAGLYQDKEDKVDNDIYSKIIDYIVTNYEDWNRKGDLYSYNINSLGVTLYYDGVSQPKIKVSSGSSYGGTTTQNISTLLKKPGGRVLLSDIYRYFTEK